MKKLTLATLLLSLGVYANANIHTVELDTCIDTSKHSNKSFKQMKQLLVSTMQEKAYNKLYKEQTGKDNKNSLTSSHREDLYVEVKGMYDKGNNFCNKATVSIKDKRLQYYLPQKVSLDRICHKDEDLSPNKLKEQAELKTYKALIAEVSKKEISNEQAKDLVHNYKKSDGKMYMSKGAYCLGASGEVVAFEVDIGVNKVVENTEKKVQLLRSLNNGLVAYYPFENNTNDKLAYNIEYKQGIVGKAAYFNGTSSYINIGNSSDFNFDSSKSFSISLFIKLDKNSKFYYDKDLGKIYPTVGLVSKFNRFVGAEFQLSMDLENKITLSRNAPPWRKDATTRDSLNYDKFYHIVATYDGNVEKIFVDGALVGFQQKGTQGAYSNKDVLIGTTLVSNAPTSFFNGLIDELRIYNRALTQTEISSLYKRGTN